MEKGTTHHHGNTTTQGRCDWNRNIFATAKLVHNDFCELVDGCMGVVWSKGWFGVGILFAGGHSDLNRFNDLESESKSDLVPPRE
jgi:hypothetical protein